MRSKAPKGAAPASKLDLKARYSQFVGFLKGQGVANPMHAAVGGEFHAFGVIEREMLRFFGLKPNDMLIDVGCGSGRLAIPLSKDHPGGYLGTDLVEDLLDHARAHCDRPDWRFEAVDGLAIPAPDGEADMVAFFSVLTHLLHEQSYLYLEEARRVLRPGGRIVFSFLEYALPGHREVFEATVEQARHPGIHPLNVLIEREAIRYWSERLGLPIVEIRDGREGFVPLPTSLALEDGGTIHGPAALGQSICVLEKPA